MNTTAHLCTTLSLSFLPNRYLPRPTRRVFLLPDFPGASVGGGEDEGASVVPHGRLRGGRRGVLHPGLGEHRHWWLAARRRPRGNWVPVEIASSSEREPCMCSPIACCLGLGHSAASLLIPARARWQCGVCFKCPLLPWPFAMVCRWHCGCCCCCFVPAFFTCSGRLAGK